MADNKRAKLEALTTYDSSVAETEQHSEKYRPFMRRLSDVLQDKVAQYAQLDPKEIVADEPSVEYKLGVSLRNLRHQCGLSREALAQIVGVDDHTIVFIENGLLSASTLSLALVTDIFQVLSRVCGDSVEKNQDAETVDFQSTSPLISSVAALIETITHLQTVAPDRVKLSLIEESLPTPISDVAKIGVIDSKPPSYQNRRLFSQRNWPGSSPGPASNHWQTSQSSASYYTSQWDKSGIARIWHSDQVVGTAFLVGHRQLLTSPGVIARALGEARVPETVQATAIFLDFPESESRHKFRATVRLWHPDKGIAGLELQESSPADVTFYYLASITTPDEIRFQTVGATKNQLHPISGQLKNQQLSRSYPSVVAGSPVWHETFGGVVGMLTTDDLSSRAEADHFVPASLIEAAWTGLFRHSQGCKRHKLYQFIVKNYTGPQLEALCAVLSIPTEILQVKGQGIKVSRLLTWADDNQRMSNLIEQLKNARNVPDGTILDRLQAFEDKKEKSIPSLAASTYTILPKEGLAAGRRKLLGLIKKGLMQEDVTTSVAIWGQRGVGKTTLALALVQEYETEFPGGIFWASLNEHDGDVRSILTDWAKQCEPNFVENWQGVDWDKFGFYDLVRDILDKYIGTKPALFVIDEIQPCLKEADALAQVRALKQVMPRHTASLLVLQDEQVAKKLGHSEKVDLLTEGDAIDLLNVFRETYLAEAETEQARDLVVALGRLPQVIKLAGAYLEHHRDDDYGVAELLQALRTLPQTIDFPAWLAEAELSATVQGNISYLVTLSYEALSAPVKHLFRHLAVFAPTTPIKFDSVVGVTGLSEAQVSSSLALLSAMSLINYQSTTGYVFVPSLLRQFGRYQLQETNEAEQARHAHFMFFLEFAMRYAKVDPDAHKMLAAALPNFLLAFDYAIETNNYQAIKEFGFALCMKSRFLAKQGHLRHAIAYLPKTAEACRILGHRKDEAWVYGRLGMAYTDDGQWYAAQDYFEEALIICRTINDPIGEGNWLSRLGLLYYKIGHLDRAVIHQKASLDIYRREGDQRLEGIGLQRLGLIYSDRGQKELALQHYQEALHKAEIKGHAYGQAVALAGLGLVYRYLGQNKLASDYFEKALAIHYAHGNFRELADTLNDIGLVYYNWGQIDNALTNFSKALAISKEKGFTQSKAIACGNLGLAYRHLGKLTEAIRYFELAINLSRQGGATRRDEANGLANLAIAYRYQGNISAAIQCIEQSLEIRQVIGDRRGEGACYGHLGLCYLNLGKHDKAQTYLQQGLEISREVGERRSEGNILAHLARTLRHSGHVLESIEYLVQALIISKEIGHERSRANRMGRLANAYRKLGKLDKARNLVEKAIAVSHKIKDARGEADNLGYLGLIYREMGEYYLAHKCIQEALDTSHEIGNERKEGIWYGHLGTICFYSKQYDQALSYLDKAHTISKKVGDLRQHGNHHGNLGLIYYSTGQTGQALYSINEALEIHIEVGEQLKIATSYLNLGTIYSSKELDQPTEAITYYKLAHDLYQNIGYKVGQSKALSCLGNVYVDLNQPERAIEYIKQALTMSQEDGNVRNEIDQFGQLIDLYRRQPDYIDLVNKLEGKLFSLCKNASYWSDRQKSLTNKLVIY